MAVIDRFSFEGLEGLRVGRFNIGINTSFIVYRLDGTVIDTGSTNQWRYVKAYLQEKPLEQLILTHHHEDHAGNTGSITELTGIKAVAPELTVEKIRHSFKTPLLQKIIWGSPRKADADVLPDDFQLSNGEQVTAIHTPGHAQDMTCYLLPERGWLFSADLYLANKLKILRADENIPEILKSIERVLEYDFDIICCPHRGIVHDGATKLKEKHDYIVNIAGDAQKLREEGLPVKQIALKLLGKEDLFAKLSGYNFSRRNLIASCLDVEF